MIRSYDDKTFFFSTCDCDKHCSMDVTVTLSYVEELTAVCFRICTLRPRSGEWKGKESAFIQRLVSKHSDMDHTVLPANYIMPAFGVLESPGIYFGQDSGNFESPVDCLPNTGISSGHPMFDIRLCDHLWLF